MAEADRKRAAEARALGLCVRCLKQPAAPGIVRCEECRGRTKAVNDARSDSRKAQGICVSCGKAPAAPGIIKCAECAARSAETGKRWSKNNRERVNVHMIERNRRRREAKLCVRCGKPSYGYYCDECIEKIKAGKEAREHARIGQSQTG